MDQQKVGSFLKKLRSEKNITQEQLAELMSVSRRTVSRWETGSNMPDLDILMEMADYYKVELRELLEGERQKEHMDNEMKETVLKVADYSNEEKLKITRRMHLLFITGCVFLILYLVLQVYRPETPGKLFEFFEGVSLGFSFGMLVVGTIMTSKYAKKIRAFKMKLLGKNEMVKNRGKS